jgi:uncharacterized membrane protein YhaH (DUF805 family)
MESAPEPISMSTTMSGVAQYVAPTVVGGRPPQMMPFVDAFKAGMQKYANFEGRASRSEYWWFYLWVQLLSIPAGVMDGIIGREVQLVSALVSLIFLLPSLSVGVRRLHDSGKSGWNLLWSLTIIGIFYVIYLTIIEGETVPNAYGAVPTNTL